MVVSPLGTDIQKSFRDTFGTNFSPNVIDSDQAIIPVAVVAQSTSASNASNVKITDGTDTLLVDTSGNLTALIPIPTGQQTLKTFTIASTSGAVENAGTVTTGKTFYMYGYGVVDGTAGNLYIYKEDGTTLIGRSNPGASGSGQGVTSMFCPIYGYPSASNIKVKGDAGHSIVVWGVEV